MGLRSCILTTLVLLLLSSVPALRIDGTLVELRKRTGINSRQGLDCNGNITCILGSIGHGDRQGGNILGSGPSSSSASDSLPSPTSTSSDSVISSTPTENLSSSTAVSLSSGAGSAGHPDSSITKSTTTSTNVAQISSSSDVSSGAHSTSNPVPSSSSPLITSTILPSATALSSEDHHHERLDIPTIVGSVLGGITIITLIATFIICWKRKTRKRLRRTVGSLIVDPFLEPPRDVVPVPVLRMEKPMALDNAINSGQASQIPPQKSRRRRMPAIANLISRTTPEVQVAEAPEEINQRTQPVLLVVDEHDEHDERVESVEDSTGIQSDLNFVTVQHLDSGVRVVELPPTYSSL